MYHFGGSIGCDSVEPRKAAANAWTPNLEYSMPFFAMPSAFSQPQDPAIPIHASRLYSDGRTPCSWSILPNELQLQALEHLFRYYTPVSSSRYAQKKLLDLVLVNKRMADQVRHVYQKNHFILVHGSDYVGSSDPNYQGILVTGFGYEHVDASRFLKHPTPRFCHEITSLELHFFPSSIDSSFTLADTYSFAPLLRHREDTRLARSRSILFSEVMREADNARRIAWQAEFHSLRHLTVRFDFRRAIGDRLEDRKLAAVPQNAAELLLACWDSRRAEFVSALNMFETAFPNLESVNVTVQNLSCIGHDGTWSREKGLVRGQMKGYWWNTPGFCPRGCPERIGLALEAALLRSTWEEL